MNIKTEPGWTGVFTRDEVLGAWRNGTRVVKHKSEPGDGTPDGTPGVVLGSMLVRDDDSRARLLYFIEWADHPRLAVACVATKLRHADA